MKDSATNKMCFRLMLVLTVFLCLNQQSLAQTEQNDQKSVRPVLYGLVIDRSASLRSIIGVVAETGRVIISQNQKDDETFFISFVSSDKITVEVSNTKNKNEIISALEDIYPESGQSAVFDALFFSAQYSVKNIKCEQENCTRNLVLISDGEDSASDTKEKEVLDYLKTNNFRVLTIGLNKLVENATRTKTDKKAYSFLNKLAKETKGKVYYPRNIGELNENIKELVKLIRE